MKNIKNRVAMVLLFSGVMVASEIDESKLSTSLGELSVASDAEDEFQDAQEEVTAEQQPAHSFMVVPDEVAGALDAESFDAAVSNAGTIAGVLKQASQPLPSSILRAVNRDRVANGLLPTDNLSVVRPSQEQIDQANREQAVKDAVHAAVARGYSSQPTSYLSLSGGYRRK